jgi:omega-amidase
MRLLGLQYDIAWEDRAANVATVGRLTARAAPPPGSLIVLPEMAFTGFSMRVERVSEGADGQGARALADLARTWRSWVVGGLVTTDTDGRGRNEAALFGPDGAPLGRYAKMHPFTSAGEEQHYAAGGDVLVLPCGGFQVAPVVCYDLRFPEIFRTAVRRGATLFVVIANWLEARHAHWSVLLQARAVENQAWVIGVNRVGRDPRHGYPGGSCLIDPAGRVVAQAGADEAVVEAEVRPESVAEVRGAFPVLRDLRPEWTRP